ncbi:MAE_28990/MAE_18760 family HEPN-like nuclease [Peptoniphilus sp. DNF00840]|uniref:MAE_28990/MAE_18760 family HEPN-like nuclease n=1 Tax=Peptoniphilus sp. DNF00840 TaxID=1477000 RepID=UPI000782A792|nr:MAE_28990/MAE_18760 family HEPN-like nuclease [Peptoniphilus sp. DNF00840]KXB69463.1 hypothetical protein HMPREF1864_01412 [Peptoniphilus sp. DNF00840]
MKIKNLEELEDRIDDEIAWRKKELISIKNDVGSSENKDISEQSRLIRSGIAMLYAHWEGAIKSLAEYYLIYVSSLNLRYCELKNNFLAIDMKESLNKYAETKKASVHNKFLHDLYEKQNQPSKIPYKNIIKTNSNLKMDILKEITETIGLDSSPYELKKMLIDQRLLGNRNQIAHGQRLEKLEGISNISDFLELHEAVYELIELFANNIKTAAQNEDYKSNKSGF